MHPKPSKAAVSLDSALAEASVGGLGEVTPEAGAPGGSFDTAMISPSSVWATPFGDSYLANTTSQDPFHTSGDADATPAARDSPSRASTASLSRASSGSHHSEPLPHLGPHYASLGKSLA